METVNTTEVSFTPESNDSYQNVPLYDDILVYSRGEVREPHEIIALVLCCLAITVNIFCLLAILQIHGKLTAHFRLIISLASSDILIATSVMLHMINKVVFPIYWKPGVGGYPYRLRRCVAELFKALNTTALNISLLNLMGMAIDLYLAILRPLHYPQLMAKQRVNLMIALLWIVAIFCGFSDPISVWPERRHLNRFNLCEMTFMTPYQGEYTVFAIAFICLFIMLFIYIRIYVQINQQHTARQFRLQEDKRRHHVLEFKRNKKALMTTLMILGSFVLCWLPLCLFQIILLVQVSIDASALRGNEASLLNVDKFLYDLLLLNAIFDPIVYAIRMPEVRFGYRRLWIRISRKFRRPTNRWGNSFYSTYGDRKSAYPDPFPVSRQGSEMSNSKRTTVQNITVMESKL